MSRQSRGKGAKASCTILCPFSMNYFNRQNQRNAFLLQKYANYIVGGHHPITTIQPRNMPTTLWAGITPSTQFNHAICQLHCGRASSHHHNSTTQYANYIVGGHHPVTTIQPRNMPTTLWAGIIPSPQFNHAICQLHCGRASPRHHNSTTQYANYIVGRHHPVTTNSTTQYVKYIVVGDEPVNRNKIQPSKVANY